jgi:O-6-methylguanine DNA methyltransferase
MTPQHVRFAEKGLQLVSTDPQATVAAAAEARRLKRELRMLGMEPAPATLLPGVLSQIGLADAYTQMLTPIGRAYVAFRGERVLAVVPAASDAAFEAQYRARYRRPIHRAQELPARVERALRLWQHEKPANTLQFQLAGLTPFEQAVLTKTTEIPSGQVRSYAWVAKEIGHPQAVRAVGTALGHNPIPFLIPCHRVIRSDGTVGQYGYGTDAKRAMLTAEGVDIDAAGRVGPDAGRIVGSDSTKIYCVPTCHHARRVTPAHRVAFRDQRAAAAAGYRPCLVCRP